MMDSHANVVNPELARQESPRALDGRNINTQLGALTGEASGQAARRQADPNMVLQSRSFPYIPSQQPGTSPAYYDRPMLKDVAWEWPIAAYFYVGGACGVATTLGAVAQLAAPNSMRSLIQKSRWIGTIGAIISSTLLVRDLGRPERFLHMLRVFRMKSPMSMGTWILVVFSSAVGATAVLPFGPRFFRPLIHLFSPIAGLFGLGLAGYTGVLITQTAVPIWQQGYRLNPILFLSSATAAASSLFEMTALNEVEHKAVTTFGLIGKAAEFTTTLMLESELTKLSRVAKPIEDGFSGMLWQAAKVLTVASALVTLLPGRSRKTSFVAGLLGSLASLSLRFGIFLRWKAFRS